MGNILLKLSCCWSKLSLCGDETSKIQGETITSKDNTLQKRSEISKNKKRKGKGKVISFLVSQKSLPQEIIVEILSWLPVKSLLKMKCVCKQWYALTQDRHFLEKHMSRARRHDSRLYRISSSESFIRGCDGLWVMKNNASQKYFIKNPAIHHILDLPDPSSKNSIAITFSFIPSTGDYKLVFIYDDEGNQGKEGCEILTIGIDNSWRPLNMPKNGSQKKKRIMIVSAGLAVHFIRVVEVGSNLTTEVVSLDLVSESFTSTILPRGLFSDWRKVWALDWNGCLSFADIVQENLNVTVLEDYKKLKWCKENIVVPLTFMKDNSDPIENLVPLYAKSGDLLFRLKDEKIIACDIQTMKIKYTIEAREGYAFPSRAVYVGPPSLVTLKGMRPDKEESPLKLPIKSSFWGSLGLAS